MWWRIPNSFRATDRTTVAHTPGATGNLFAVPALRQNLWAENDDIVTSRPPLKLDRGGPPLAPLPSHQPSNDGAKG